MKPNPLLKKLTSLGLDKLPDPSPKSAVGKMFKACGVPETRELKRIAATPRRSLDDYDLDAIAEEMSDELRTADGSMRLRPLQAAALLEMHDFGGLLGSIRVGGGKTLVTFLAPVIMGADRPFLIVPASLRDKTLRDFDALRKHWIGPAAFDDYPVFSYEALARENNAELFSKYRPDLIVADEVHRMKNQKAAVTRRVKRYMHDRPDTRFVGLSGTLTKRSLLDFGHLSDWALKDLSPVPRLWPELYEWSLAVDEKIPSTLSRQRPGALAVLFDAADRANAEVDREGELMAARSAVGRRVRETPGVVSSGDDVVPISLAIVETRVEVPRASKIAEAVRMLEERWALPNGFEIADAVELWRHTRELGQGFYYEWETPAPRSWLDARRVWAKACRDTLKANRRGLDTQAQLANAILRGEYDDDQELVDAYYSWTAVRDSFEPETRAEWLSLHFLKELRDSADRGKPSIIWVEHRAVGDKLAELYGFAYFAAMGLDANNRPIESVDPQKEPIVVASIASCGTGRNLQAWAHNVVACAPPGGSVWEQMLGRTHRDGQEADEVRVVVLHGSAQSAEDMAQARRDAAYVETLTGQPQKLLIATRENS